MIWNIHAPPDWRSIRHFVLFWLIFAIFQNDIHCKTVYIFGSDRSPRRGDLVRAVDHPLLCADHPLLPADHPLFCDISQLLLNRGAQEGVLRCLGGGAQEGVLKRSGKQAGR